MAPEVLANEEYKATDEDLFSAAVILFILLTQHPPFIRADPNDKYYKKIFRGEWDKFWSIHEDENLSASFIDLFTRMVSFKPSERLSLEEVKRHKWYRGPVATKADLVKTFNERKTILTKLNLSKENNTELPDSSKRIPKKSMSSKSMKKTKKHTRFVEVSDGDELLDIVIKFAQEQNISFNKSKDFYRVELTFDDKSFDTKVQVNVLKNPDQEMR
mmetsp:Transcript_2078/g.2630  ORF Transcript_2078/g.2630 Transcript_2078/m.2630 type:complete len:216 (-) Transcript_2078:143-790(-)